MRDAGAMVLAEKTSYKIEEIGEIPLPRFWEMLIFYSNPKDYVKPSDEAILDDLRMAERLEMERMARRRKEIERN